MKNHRQKPQSSRQEAPSYKMDPRVKALWVQHLRSDWYDQNFGPGDDEDGHPLDYYPLRTNDDRWTPLGVLCNIYAQEHVEECSSEMFKTEFMGYMYYVPQKVLDWAGLCHNSRTPFKKPVRLSINSVFESVEAMVVDNVPFYIIADVIDERL